MNRFFRIILALTALSFIIVIHEFGHFFACKLFNVGTPIFSVGFGPRLLGVQIGQTVFQLALLPLGGYVSINQAQLAAQPYLHKLIIILAGIVINLVFGFGLLYAQKNRPTPASAAILPTDSGVVGPIGIISIMEKSIAAGPYYFWRIIAVLSINVGIFNLLPIPMLDGGQLLMYTIQAIAEQKGFLFAKGLIALILTIFLVLLLTRDVRRLKNEK